MIQTLLTIVVVLAFLIAIGARWMMLRQEHADRRPGYIYDRDKPTRHQ